MTVSDGLADNIRQLLVRKGRVIEQLLGGGASVQELTMMVDESSRSIRRALERSVSHGLARHEHNIYRLTQLGYQVAWAHCDYRQQIETLVDAGALLSRLPDDELISQSMMAGVEIAIEPPEAPESAWQPVDRAVDEADQVRGIAPKVTPSYIDTFYREIVEGETAVELILPPDVLEAITKHYDREWQGAILADNCTFMELDAVPEYGILIIDDEVWIGVYRGSGSALIGTLRNDSPRAVDWAIELFDEHRENATDVLDGGLQ